MPSLPKKSSRAVGGARRRKHPGQPVKEVTAAKLRRVEALAAKGYHLGTIARELGMSDETLRARRRDDPRIDAAIAAGEARYHDRHIDNVNKSAERNFVPSLFILKARFGYRDSGPPDGEARPAVVINLPGSADPAAWAKLIERPVIEGTAKPDDEGGGDGAR